MEQLIRDPDPLELSWVSEAGLPCHIFPCRFSSGNYHLCGYVQVPEGHPLHGVEYNADVPESLLAVKEMVLKQPTGKRGIMNVLCAAGLGLKCGDLFDVHGSITFSRNMRHDFGGGFWYGFDCGHHGDDPAIHDQAYVRAECESLARQMVALTAVSS